MMRVMTLIFSGPLNFSDVSASRKRVIFSAWVSSATRRKRYLLFETNANKLTIPRVNVATFQYVTGEDINVGFGPMNPL